MAGGSSEFLNLALGGGGAVVIGAVFTGVKAIMAGSRTNVREAISDLEKWRHDSDDAREWEAIQHLWWRDWAGKLAYALTTRAGAEALPSKEPYPIKMDKAHQ